MKPRILIADDNQQLLSALRIELDARRYEVITCADAYMALELAVKHMPDVMVLDIRMPAGEGFSVMERMFKVPELQGIPVIFITGDKSPLLSIKAEKLGALALLYKPIRLSELLKMIDAALKVRCRAPNEQPPAAGSQDIANIREWSPN